MISKGKKIIVFILIVLMVLPSAFIFGSRKANAAACISITSIVDDLCIKEILLDGIAYPIINAITAEMTRATIAWINGENYIGPSGGRTGGFVKNPQNFLQNVADRALGSFISENIPLLCTPFRLNVQTSLNFKYKSNINNNYCTLVDSLKNTQNAYENFTQNFNNGGWKSWINITTIPQNNQYGASFIADTNAGAYIGNKTLLEAKTLDWGQGFLSWKKGSGECSEFATISLSDENGEPYLGGVKHWINPTTKEDLGVVLDPLEPPCTGSDTRKEQIETPGSFLENSLTNAIGLSGSRLTIADEINEIIGALITKLIGVGFNALGLGNADTTGEEDAINSAKRQITNFTKQTNQSINDYIDIKKRSLELNGKFSTEGVDIESGLEEKKVDWKGNVFDWNTERYYVDSQAKIDWRGDLFNWEPNKYYNAGSDGKITEASCLIQDDVYEKTSLFVSKDSSGNVSTFWSKAICTRTTFSGEKIFWMYDGKFSPGGDAFVTKTAEGICNSNNVGTKGYTIKTQIDTFWNESTCEKKTSGIYDWSATSQTTFPIRKTVTTKSFIRKIDWNGLLFNWDEGVALDGRNWYAELKEMEPIKRTYLGGSSLNIATLDGKICFPASESRGNNQNIFGVKQGEKNWTSLRCTKNPSLKDLQWFYDPAQRNAQLNDNVPAGGPFGIDWTDYGVWERAIEKPPAYKTIGLEGKDFENLIDTYGSAEVKKMFDDLLACLKTKSGDNSQDISEIIGKMDERKVKRLQLVMDILLAKKMLLDMEFLQGYSNGLGSGGSFDYTNFLSELEKTSKVIGFTEDEISAAHEEQNNIIAENTRIKTRLNSCVDPNGGSEADYQNGYSEGKTKGTSDGYKEGSTGQTSRLDTLPKNDKKVGYSNGYQNGYYDGYKIGFENGTGSSL